MGSTTYLDQFASKLRKRIIASERGNPGGVLTEQDFNGLALELFALQYETNEAYRVFCQSRRARPESFKYWEEIPAIPTAAFKELELSSLAPCDRTAVFYSSGTTQQRPSRHFHNLKSLQVYEASLLAWFREHFLPETEFCTGQDRNGDGWNFLFLTPPASEAPHSSLVHMFEAIRRVFGSADSVFLGKVAADGAWGFDPELLAAAVLKIASSGKPVALLGTAFSFVHLVDYMEERELTLELPPGSRVFETGGYKGRSRALPKNELHSLITSRLGMPGTHLVSEYGMSELSSQAYDRVVGDLDAERIFYFPPWAWPRIVSPETGREVDEGKTGLVRIVDLANVYSALTIQTEDLATRRGSGFELIGRRALAEARGCSLMAAL